MPQRPCIACGVLVTAPASYCKRHQPSRRGGRWRTIRAQVLRRDNYRCWCGKPAVEVDHLSPAGGDQLWNLRAVCVKHNPRGHAGFQA